jgi:hypothetical protein
MLVPPYTVTFQPSSSGTALVSRVIVPRPSGASGVHEGPMVPVLETYQSLGGPYMISSQRGKHRLPHATIAPPPGITNTLVHLTIYQPQVTLVRDAQVAPLRQDLPQRLVVGSCPIDSTLTTHLRRTPRFSQFFYQVYQVLGTTCLIYIYTSHLPASHHRYNASKSKSSNM